MLDVACLLRADLGLRDRIARLLEPRLDLDLLGCARPQLRRGLLTHRRVGRELLGKRVTPCRHRVGRALERGRGALGLGREVAAPGGAQCAAA